MVVLEYPHREKISCYLPITPINAFVEARSYKFSTDMNSMNTMSTEHKAAGSGQDCNTITHLANENANLFNQVRILESIPDWVLAFDSEGRVFYSSKPVLHFLGLNEENVEGTLLWEYFTHGSKALIKRAYNDVIMNDSKDDGSPLACGRPLLVKLRSGEKSQLVSLTGIVHLSENDGPSCVCSMRPVVTPRSNMASTVISLSSASSEDEREKCRAKAYVAKKRKRSKAVIV